MLNATVDSTSRLHCNHFSGNFFSYFLNWLLYSQMPVARFRVPLMFLFVYYILLFMLGHKLK